MDCPICCEPYTAVKRRQIVCRGCDESACAECVQKYLMMIIEEPHCPSCRVGWSNTFLHDELSFSFIKNKYSVHRAELLWAQQESYLPATQEAIAAAKTKGAVTNGAIITGIFGMDPAELVKNKKVVRKCPVDNCKGFLNEVVVDDVVEGAGAGAGSESVIEKKIYMCGLCDRYTCIRCMQPHKKDEKHKCKKDDVDTVALLMKDSKPCPKCGEMISKSFGCDQMWCTACNTPFSWSTLTIIKSGTIHNPHYFEFMRNNPHSIRIRPLEIVGCGELPQANVLIQNIRTSFIRDYIHPYYYNPYDIESRINKIYQHIIHVREVEYETYNPTRPEGDYLRLRVEYLLNMQTKEDVQQCIGEMYDTDETKRAIRPILETYVALATDILMEINIEEVRKYTNNDEKKKYLNDILDKYKPLCEFINKELEKVCMTYRCEIPYLDTWGWNTMSYSRLKARDRVEVVSDYALRPRVKKESSPVTSAIVF